MSYKYNPSVTELRQAYEVAYGDGGAQVLSGAMFASLDSETIERLYGYALDKIREDTAKFAEL
jgi:uncharacterized membrane protein YecN with MAPEG domain